MKTNLLAELVSRLFGTPWLLILVLAAFYYSNSLNSTLPALILLGLTLLFSFFLPAGFFVQQLKTSRVEQLDAPRREQRIPTYLVALGGWSVSLLVIKLAGQPYLFSWLRIYYLLVAALVLTTFFYKVSVHAALNAAVLTTLVWIYGWIGLFYLPVLVLVMWSRLRKKIHRTDQLVIGAGLGILITSLGFWLK